MSAVSENLVREYFELHGFFVRQQRKYVAPARTPEEEDADFLVLNPHYDPGAKPPPFILSSGDLAGVNRAVVVVKGWHTETFTTARLAQAPEIFRFLEPPAFKQATRAFGPDGSALKIMVLPALPQGPEAREQSMELLRGKGIDGIIPFRSIVADLIAKIEPNRNYQKSDLLQVLRILKNYDFLKDSQLELFKPGRKKARKRGDARTP